MDWMKLKSGSDVRGTAVGDNAVLTPHVASCLGMAFANFLAERLGKSNRNAMLHVQARAEKLDAQVLGFVLI